MPYLTDQQLANALLTIVSAVPTPVPWNAVAIHGLGVVLVWDKREDADGAQSRMVASSVEHVTVEGSPLVAAMIRPAGDLEEAAGTLRVTYPLATAPDDPIDPACPEGPF